MMIKIMILGMGAVVGALSIQNGKLPEGLIERGILVACAIVIIREVVLCMIGA